MQIFTYIPKDNRPTSLLPSSVLPQFCWTRADKLPKVPESILKQVQHSAQDDVPFCLSSFIIGFLKASFTKRNSH